jgi:hypothetical protein
VSKPYNENDVQLAPAKASLNIEENDSLSPPTTLPGPPRSRWTDVAEPALRRRNSVERRETKLPLGNSTSTPRRAFLDVSLPSSALLLFPTSSTLLHLPTKPHQSKWPKRFKPLPALSRRLSPPPSLTRSPRATSPTRTPRRTLRVETTRVLLDPS